MKIRLRLALFGAVVVAAAMLAFGVVINLLAQQAPTRDQDDVLARLAESAAADLASAPPNSLLASNSPVRVDLAEGTDTYLAILNESGQILYSTGQIGGNPPAIPAAVVVEALERGASSAVFTTQGVELNVQARVWERTDLGVGVIVAGQSTAIIDEQLQGLSALLWVVGIIMTLVVSFVGWLVAGRALRPLRQLASTTEEVRQTGDLSGHLPPARNDKDEVGVLTASFNGMLQSLQESRHELSESLAAQRRFVADASHELRSPLTTIRNNAEFLAERPEAADTDRTEALQDIVAESERMSELVGDLLILAHGDAGRELERRPIDLSALVQELVRRRSDVDLVRVGPAMVLGDESALNRLAVILLDNAAKHGGGPTTVSVLSEDGQTVLAVADEGPGIPPEDLGRLFDRFYRADPARGAEGFGLGLAIAAEIVAAHEGTISAANRPDGGAVFTAFLPAA